MRCVYSFVRHFLKPNWRNAFNGFIGRYGMERRYGIQQRYGRKQFRPVIGGHLAGKLGHWPFLLISKYLFIILNSIMSFPYSRWNSWHGPGGQPRRRTPGPLRLGPGPSGGSQELWFSIERKWGGKNTEKLTRRVSTPRFWEETFFFSVKLKNVSHSSCWKYC